MGFTELQDFLLRRMRMSHIYQPVMLRRLLLNRGRATTREIACEILSNDESQIEYYESITRNMVGRVLRERGVVTKEGANYVLNGFDQLTELQVQELTLLCDRRLAEYVERRGLQVWQHRKQASGYISGTVRYEVLKRAAFRCELCGVPADVKALEVDHIIPRSMGGPDDLQNFQALCYSCNSMKQARDDTDFRAVRASYDHREPGCVFCSPGERIIVAENRLAYAIRDRYPVTALHTLVIPRRHLPDYFALSRPELNSCDELIRTLRSEISSSDKSVAGFNVGTNAGDEAGQTVMHCHIHVIPRRKGDVPDPRGGIRHTIPGKGSY